MPAKRAAQIKTHTSYGPHSLMEKQLPLKQLTLVRFQVGAPNYEASSSIEYFLCILFINSP